MILSIGFTHLPEVQAPGISPSRHPRRRPRQGSSPPSPQCSCLKTACLGVCGGSGGCGDAWAGVGVCGGCGGGRHCSDLKGKGDHHGPSRLGRALGALFGGSFEGASCGVLWAWVPGGRVLWRFRWFFTKVSQGKKGASELRDFWASGEVRSQMHPCPGLVPHGHV